MCHKQIPLCSESYLNPNQNILIIKISTFDSAIRIQMDLNNTSMQAAIFNVITIDGLHNPVPP